MAGRKRLPTPGVVQGRSQAEPGQEKKSGCELCLSLQHTFPFLLGIMGSLLWLGLCFEDVRNCRMKERGPGDLDFSEVCPWRMCHAFFSK